MKADTQLKKPLKKTKSKEKILWDMVALADVSYFKGGGGVYVKEFSIFESTPTVNQWRWCGVGG